MAGKLIICRGLPASGKTTWAKQYVPNHPNSLNLDRDMFRVASGFNLVPGEFESTVTMLVDNAIKAGLRKNYTVIESSTNLNNKNLKHLAAIAENAGAEVEVRDFDTPLEECIGRDALRGLTGGHTVGEDVIRRMYKRYFIKGQFPANPLEEIKGIEFEPYVRNVELPKVVLVDIDGTIAENVSRSPYDYTKVNEDLPYEDVITFIHYLAYCGVKPIFLSGRKMECRQATVEWIKKCTGLLVDNEHLFMRADGDDRVDYVIKYKLFDKHIRNNYNVVACIDDRRQVIDMYRSIGLRVYDVAGNEF